MNVSLARILSAAVIAVVALPLLVSADDPPKGDLWETTSQMSMEGMPMKMPVNKLKLCVAKDRTEPAGAEGQHNCTNSNYHREGSKVTWTSQCTDPDMTGTGEITYDGPDSYSGTVKYSAAQGTMTIALTGHKVGECDNPH